MESVLLVIEGGRNAEPAIRQTIDLYRQKEVRIYLLNVRTPFPQHISRFTSKQARDQHHQENGMGELNSASKIFDAAGVPHRNHVEVGQKAEEIVRFAKEHHCCKIIVAKHPAGLVGSVVMGSTASRIRDLFGEIDVRDTVCEEY